MQVWVDGADCDGTSITLKFLDGILLPVMVFYTFKMFSHNDASSEMLARCKPGASISLFSSVK